MTAPDMAASSSASKKYLKLFLIAMGVLVLSIIGLNIWFVHNAKGVLKNIVATKSGGKIKLELSNLYLNVFNNKLQVRQADIMSVDSLNQPVTYHVRFRKLTLRVASFWPLLLQNKLLLDSIKLHDPSIEVVQWRKDTAVRTAREDLSIPQQMGTLYNSMLDVLEGFGIRRIKINNATISLVNKIKPGTQPVTISNIYFDLVRSPDEARGRDEFIENKQSVDLRTTNQNIALPGGRHRLSFKKFNLELFRKRIQLDSCTVTAIPTDSTKSSYTIFFNKLMLVGVDFTAMYRYNLIRADSVYCEGPTFDININTAIAGSGKKGRPDPEKIVQELTGDLDLAFVGVKDAGIHINITGGKERTLFNSNKDDFELRGLRINADSSEPVVVRRFDMLVQDYRLYNEDSSTAYTFDSVRFENNKIALSNFSVSTESSRRMVHNERDFKIPYFALTGLDWYELIFNQNLSAQEAYLYNPIINYKRTKPMGARKKVNLYSSLQSLDSFMTLNKINVVNGKINMDLGGDNTINLQDVDLSLNSNRLLESTNDKGIRRAVEQLSFSQGRIRFKDLTAQLQNARYTGANLMHADKLTVSSRTGKVAAIANDVYLDNLLLDDDQESIVVDGVRWRNAVVSLKGAGGGAKPKGKGGSLALRNISGGPTVFSYTTDKMRVKTTVQSLRLALLERRANGDMHTEGFSIAGNGLSLNNGPLQVNASAYNITDNTASFITGLKVEKLEQGDTMMVKAPRVNFLVDIDELLAKDVHLKSAAIDNPDIFIRKWGKAEKGTAKSSPIRIDQLVLHEPVLSVATHYDDSVSTISLPHSENSVVKATGIVLNGENIKLGSLSANTTAATFAKRDGSVLGVEKGLVQLNVSDIVFTKGGDKPVWSGVINNLQLQNPNTITIGKNKNKLMLEQATFGNLSLSSESLTDFDKLVKLNVSAWLRTATGQYIDSNTTLKWYNAGYNSGTKTLRLDSFAYYPTQPRDSVVAKTPYQIDYITLKTGPVELTDFNLDEYKRDSALIAHTINITNPVITLYRDKLPPFLAGRIKPLPVDMIKRIALPLSVKNVNLIDGSLSYTERNWKTRAEGTLHLTHLDGGLYNIKNRNLVEGDSLLFVLNAYLMDSALLNLRVKESYTDSLSGFLMTLRMRPTNLTFLNPVLAPLSNVIITSGQIDSFQLRAIGQEDLALGEMKMYYRGLKIKLVKDGNPEETSFSRKVASFLANALVIKKNNNGRTGLVYFQRLRDRSFFNYIVKMTFSGMATSIGARSNKKYLKQYKRQLRQRALPPIELQ